MTDRSALDDDVEHLFAEVLDAAAILAELTDAARVEAWGSSALSVWREDPDAPALDAELLTWLARQSGPVAPLLSAVVRRLLGADPVPAPADGPPWLPALGTAKPTRAWQIHDRRGRSIGIGFVYADGSELSLLAEIDGSLLTAIVLAPGPDELFDEAEDVVAPEALDRLDAARTVTQAWRGSRNVGIPDAESTMVNLVLARVLLETVTGDDLADLSVLPDVVEGADDGDSAERAELDAWALAVLDGALGGGVGGASIPVELLVPFSPSARADYPREERDAFAALEWADWLGVVLGLVRAGAGADAAPRALVDYVNRCPEVTSSIPKQDRPYYEWALQHVVVLWQRHGIIDDTNAVTEHGIELLPALLRAAWSP